MSAWSQAERRGTLAACNRCPRTLRLRLFAPAVVALLAFGGMACSGDDVTAAPDDEPTEAATEEAAPQLIDLAVEGDDLLHLRLAIGNDDVLDAQGLVELLGLLHALCALGLVLAGAAGNMIDRLRLGYVVDFIHFRVGWFDFPVFNVADSCVVIGAALLVLASFLGERREQRAAQAANGASGADFKRGPGPRQHVLDDMPEVPPLPPRGQGDQE